MIQLCSTAEQIDELSIQQSSETKMAWDEDIGLYIFSHTHEQEQKTWKYRFESSGKFYGVLVNFFFFLPCVPSLAKKTSKIVQFRVLMSSDENFLSKVFVLNLKFKQIFVLNMLASSITQQLMKTHVTCTVSTKHVYFMWTRSN